MVIFCVMNEQDMLQLVSDMPGLHLKLKDSIKAIKDAFESLGPGSISISFNGGKDCTLLLYIYHRLLLDIKYNYPIRALYIPSVSPFPQLEQFIHECEKEYCGLIRYNLDLMTIFAPLKDGLRVFLDSNPTQKAILVGTRRTDPYSQDLKVMQDTDGDWPRVLRIHPILDYSYAEIWHLLRKFNIPYCVLYDQGYSFLTRYTSLGGMNDTIPNPALKTSTGYDPAYALKDGSLERNGRNRHINKSTQ